LNLTMETTQTFLRSQYRDGSPDQFPQSCSTSFFQQSGHNTTNDEDMESSGDESDSDDDMDLDLTQAFNVNLSLSDDEGDKENQESEEEALHLDTHNDGSLAILDEDHVPVIYQFDDVGELKLRYKNEDGDLVNVSDDEDAMISDEDSDEEEDGNEQPEPKEAVTYEQQVQCNFGTHEGSAEYLGRQVACPTELDQSQQGLWFSQDGYDYEVVAYGTSYQRPTGYDTTAEYSMTEQSRGENSFSLLPEPAVQFPTEVSADNNHMHSSDGINATNGNRMNGEGKPGLMAEDVKAAKALALTNRPKVRLLHTSSAEQS
jgi:hypothetical protein